MRRRAPVRRGFGSVEALASGRFRAVYRGPDGRRRRGPLTYATRAEAERFLIGVQADLLRGQWSPPERAAVLFCEYVATFLRHRAPQLRPRTRDLYERLAARWLLAPIGEGSHRVELAALPLGSISPPLIREWWAGLIAATNAAATARTGTGGRKPHPARAWARRAGLEVPATGRLPARVMAAWEAAGRPTPADPPAPADPMAGRTVAAQAYRLLHSILAQAVQDDLIATNPARIPGAGTVDHPERMPITPAEVAALAAVVPERYRVAVLLAAWSGLRPGEVFALSTRDVDLSAGTVTVRHSLTELPGQPPTIGPPKTRAALRTVTLPAFVTAAMSEHLAAHTPAGVHPLIFTTTAGRPVSASARSSVMRRARAAIGRDDLTWHHLRHTGATLAAQAGATTAELQHRIGHSTARAASIYQHAPAHRDAALAAALHTLATTSQTAGNITELVGPTR